MKRSTAYFPNVEATENLNRTPNANIRMIEKTPSKINPIFLQDNYGIKKEGKVMNTYLTIITTVLVLTQIIRVAQNHIQLRQAENNI